MMKPKIILTTTIILILASTITNAGLVCGTDTTHVCNIMEDNTWEDTPIIPYIHQWFLPYWLPYDLPHWIPTIGPIAGVSTTITSVNLGLKSNFIDDFNEWAFPHHPMDNQTDTGLIPCI